MKKLLFMFASVLAVCALTLTVFVSSVDASDRSGRQSQTGGLRKPDGSPASTLININNVAGWIRNDGWSARIPSSGNSGVFFPRSTAAAIYQDGIVWGGNVNDGGSQVLRVGGQTYSIGTIGGRIISAGVAANPNDADVRIYRIRRDYKTADLKKDAGEFFEKGLSSVTAGDIAVIRAQYETDWNDWPASQGAPYYERNGTPGYQPSAPGSGGDEPGLADADQVIWFVCNDLNAGRTNALYGSNPIGFELQVTLWGYDRTDPLANVYFKKFTFIYKGTSTTAPGSTITDMYVGQWSDPDMGDAGDDFAGCDTSLSLVYVYNGNSHDVEYDKFGLAPPAVGYDFLQGPMVNGAPTDSAVFGLKRRYGKKNLPMTAAFYFAAGSAISDPPFTRDGSIQWYNLLRGLIPIGGAPFVHPSVPGATKFWLDGDPVAGTGRLDGVLQAPSDRRIGACSGPFTMALGDTQEVVVGVVGGIGASYLSSISVMKNNDAAVQGAYNDLFDLPKAPPSPKLRGIALDKKIILEWGEDETAINATEQFNRKGYTFEGYNLYQLPSASASFSQAKKLGTFDVVNGVRTIYDDVFDVTLGITVRVIKQTGTDVGTRRSIVLTDDAIRTLPFVNGQSYYFAVTAYGYNPSPSALTAALESSLGIITVVPQTPDPGVRYAAEYGDTLTATRAGDSDGSAVITVSDPTRLTGHNYKINFLADTVNGGFFWRVTDLTANRVVLDNQTNQAGDDNYLKVDGLSIKVLGPPPGMKNWEIPNGTRRWTFADATDFHFEGFEGSIGWDDPAHYFGVTSAQTVPAKDLKNVLIKLAAASSGTAVNPGAGNNPYGGWDVNNPGTDPNFSYAYRYLRSAAAAPARPEFAPYIVNPGGGYAYQDYKRGAPVSAWNVEVNPPVRLAVGIFENNRATGLVDGKWWPPSNGTGVNNNDNVRDWLFVFNRPYTGATPVAELQVDALNNGLPVMWWIGANRRANANFSAGDEFLILANHINSATTEFTFTAPAGGQYDLKNARADVGQINVFPNPYYGFNRAETSRQTRFVTFNHLPPTAEVRIFNLAGALVRAINKDDNSQYMNWNLQNTNGLPVASGVYIAHINMPTLGTTKTLKLIIVQEQQFLENF